MSPLLLLSVPRFVDFVIVGMEWGGGGRGGGGAEVQGEKNLLQRVCDSRDCMEIRV